MVTLILKQIPSLCLQPVIQTQLPKINMLYKKGQKVLGTVCHQSKGSLRMYLHVLNNEAGKEISDYMFVMIYFNLEQEGCTTRM
jgi:hypothetical protein